jgi:hypothetical protein
MTDEQLLALMVAILCADGRRDADKLSDGLDTAESILRQIETRRRRRELGRSEERRLSVVREDQPSAGETGGDDAPL